MTGLIRSKTNKPLSSLVIQEEGGTVNTICKAVKIAQKMVTEATSCTAEETAISEILLGIECGGSDATSGLAANPVMGFVSDCLIDLGGTAMFSETPEIVGAEHIWQNDAKTRRWGRKFSTSAKTWRRAWAE
jgi:altronate dehydratase large subunit